jgi:hypothetical protein
LKNRENDFRDLNAIRIDGDVVHDAVFLRFCCRQEEVPIDVFLNFRFRLARVVREEFRHPISKGAASQPLPRDPLLAQTQFSFRQLGRDLMVGRNPCADIVVYPTETGVLRFSGRYQRREP